MTTELFTRPLDAEFVTGDPNDVHLVCCAPDRSLCGLDVSGDFEAGDFPEELMCEICANKNRLGQKCGALFCGFRQWWRDRWSS
jgi:hypothetical protein